MSPARGGAIGILTICFGYAGRSLDAGCHHALRPTRESPWAKTADDHPSWARFRMRPFVPSPFT